MDPDRVLDKIREKDSISVIEAERGVLASFLRAERRQADRHPGSMDETFGHSFSQAEIDDVIRSEFQDLVQNVKGSRPDLTPDILRKAITKLDERVGIDDWDEDIVETHRDTCQDLIERSESGGY